jgi:MOSC domain-containing protein YiiM/GNAT superfamily N-acetyltransferase
VIDGRVLSVNVSSGGVPKLSVDSAWVGELGLEGDAHRDDTVHGGPLRAVCLFGIEAIERLQAEGHPVEPGSVGENLTTSGVDWSTLPGGTRVRVGSDVVLELIAPALPCATQRPNFIRGEFKRISHVLFPSDSRMYARVLAHGEVREGDRLEVLPAAAGNDPDAWVRLFRIDEAEMAADERLWAAAANSGLHIHTRIHEELAIAAAPGAPEPAFNHALGLRTLPHLLPRVLDFYRHHGVAGHFGLARPPWADAVPEFQLAILGADGPDLDDAAEEPLPAGVSIREIGPDDAAAWASVVVPVFQESGQDPHVWGALLPHLLATRGVHVLLAERAGRPVAGGLLSTHRKVGLLRTGVVLPEARGLGLQRALIRERIRVALADGCEVVAAHAGSDTLSERNLTASGLRRLGTRNVYRFDPAAEPGAERAAEPAADPPLHRSERVAMA